MNKQIIDHLESLLSLAAGKGYKLRGHANDTHTSDSISESVKYHCTYLDDLGCPWSVQNRILHYINNIDRQEVWEKLFKQSWRTIAAEALAA